MADLLDLYQRASAWGVQNITGAADKLDNQTPCDEWDVRTLLNHMLDTQRYFLASGRGQQASRPAKEPPSIISDDPVADFRDIRSDMIDTYGDPAVVEKTGPALGIAFADMLVHSWDLARATGQDSTMPEGLADAAYNAVHGRFTDEQRKGMFKPEIAVPDDAPAQDRLLAYLGRSPS